MNNDFQYLRGIQSPKWVCQDCGSSDVESIENARFDPNNGYAFIEACDIHVLDWCNACNEEVILDEAEPPDDPWGNAYGDPMYWVPPVDDEYWEVRGDSDNWGPHDELTYWGARLNEKKNTH